MVNWKKILVITFNVIIGAYILLAVTAFNDPAEKDVTCKGVRVVIDKGVIDGFLTSDEVHKMLVENKVDPVGKSMTDINLRTMEERLKAQELIDNVECYRTQGGNVNIEITERVPVVRVMAANGDDYYVDKDGRIMQNTGYACNLMVATGCIDHGYANRFLAPMGRKIIADDFWRNQIEQINVLPDSTVELVPRVGEHIIYIGKPDGLEKKLERLRKFYKYGLSQAGWNKYSRISVEFSNQIVCKKRRKQ